MDLEVLAQIDVNKVSRHISKTSRGIRNRLCSIEYDNGFITSQIEPLYNHRPIVANMRCGLWYVRPLHRTQYCYFKSTDGHNTQWDFSIKRLNLHLLPLITKHNGIVIVDSTRRGKKMPDAMSKTVPIWCCCINAVKFGSIQLHIPPETVSKIEYDAILERIPLFVERIKDLKILDNVVLDKPLRPIWTYPGSIPYDTLTDCEEFHPIVCCTASMQCQDGELQLYGFQYVQGAADDHELWTPHQDFTSELFWENIDRFKELTTDEEIENLILSLVLEKGLVTNESYIANITKFPNTRFSNGTIVGDIKEINDLPHGYDKVVIFTNTYKNEFLEQFQSTTTNQKLIFYPFAANKKYYKNFRDILRNLVEILHKTNGEILVLCENGEDFSIGVILCLICIEYDLNWQECQTNLITKNFIKLQLINIIRHKQCNPQRNILNSCNSILM